MLRIFICLLFISLGMQAQIGHYNQYPTKTPIRDIDNTNSGNLLDNSTILNDISFAFSFRKLKSDYTGPLVKLRRNDGQTRNFYTLDNNVFIDIAAINNWRSGQNVYVEIWYDQSGNEFHARQNNTSQQPRFIPNTNRPYFFGDGVNDALVVDTSMQILTNQGKEGTVLVVATATNRSQLTFGAIRSSHSGDRWSSHINWGNSNVYWDAGQCCYGGRNFFNSFTNNQFNLYTFIRSTNQIRVYKDNVLRLNTNVNSNYRYSRNNGFAIGAASMDNGGVSLPATNRFTEFILYKNSFGNNKRNTLHNNIIQYWGL